MEKYIKEFIEFKQKQAIKENKDKSKSNSLLGVVLFFTLITGFVYSAYENTKSSKPTTVNQSNR